MKTPLISFILFLGYCALIPAQGYLEDSIQEIETLINRNYTGRAREVALKRLDTLMYGDESEKVRKEKLDAYHRHLALRLKPGTPKPVGNDDADGDGLPDDKDSTPLIADHGDFFWHVHAFTISIKTDDDEKSFRFSGNMARLLSDPNARKNHPLALMGYDTTNLRNRIDLQLSANERLFWNDKNRHTLNVLRKFIRKDLSNARTTMAADLSFFNGSRKTIYRLQSGTAPIMLGTRKFFEGKPIEYKRIQPNAKYGSLVRFVGTLPMEELVKRLDDIERHGISISLTGGSLSITESEGGSIDLITQRRAMKASTRSITIRTHAGEITWRLAHSRSGEKVVVRDALEAINKMAKKAKGRELFIMNANSLLGIAGIDNSTDMMWLPFANEKIVATRDLLAGELPDDLTFVLVNKRRIILDFDRCHSSIDDNVPFVTYVEKNAKTLIDEWRIGQKAGLPEALFLIAECLIKGMGMDKDIRRGTELHALAAKQGLAASMNRLGELHRMGMGMEMNDELAYEWFSKAAQKGDPTGLDNLGRCYFYGLGVTRNMEEAKEAFKAAADKGHVFAQYSYGNLLFAARDFESAAIYFERASQGGYAPAMIRLGDMNRRGLGAPVNLSKAFKLWNEAAKKNNTAVYVYLADAYENGWGVEADPKRALELYAKAWKTGNLRVGTRLAKMYLNGKGTPRNPTKAMEIYKAGAELGDGESMVGMAELLFKGDGVKVDHVKAAEMFVKAADKGFPDALMRLGESYEHGRGVTCDPEKAFNYYVIAEKRGSIESAVRVGWMYETGRGVKMDLFKANVFYGKAANKGSVSGKRSMGKAYLTGRGVEKDPQKAFELLNQAYEAGDGESAFLLVNMYEEGKGIKKSHRKAMELIRVAAERGEPRAQEYISRLYYHGRENYEKDMKKSFEWMSKAAQNGHTKAFYYVGAMIENGQGVKKNVKIAKVWYKKAAKIGNRDAKAALTRLEPRKR